MDWTVTPKVCGCCGKFGEDLIFDRSSISASTVGEFAGEFAYFGDSVTELSMPEFFKNGLVFWSDGNSFPDGDAEIGTFDEEDIRGVRASSNTFSWVSVAGMGKKRTGKIESWVILYSFARKILFSLVVALFVVFHHSIEPVLSILA